MENTPPFTREQIAFENDCCRMRCNLFLSSPACRVILTASVTESPDRERILKAVSEFDDFTPENDPYGEHDFGKVTVDGDDYFWKFDYYDENFEYGVDPYKTVPHRVLTIMRADEY